ncbi:hypothetical protein L1887_07604 [Cichorium endivia]|nr:hypothetical protein L1887_07604 [Cichorium endivia]
MEPTKKPIKPLATAVIARTPCHHSGSPITICEHCSPQSSTALFTFEAMESMKLNLFVAVVVVMLMALSAVTNVAAQMAPAPAPASDAATVVPTAVASVVALSLAFLF